MSTNEIQPQRRPRRGRAGGPAPKASGPSPESLAPVIVQLAFAQAIDFFMRFGERADERAERATRRRIDLASRRA